MSLLPALNDDRHLDPRASRLDGEAPRLTLLGGFQLWHGGAPVPVAPVGQRIVALLALSEWPLSRAQLAGQVWLDASDDRAAASLRSALWRLPQPGGLPLVESTVTHVALHPRVEVDYRELTAFAAEVERPGSDLTGPTAVSLSADLLPGWYEDWVFIERERLRQLRLHALDGLSARLTASGRFGAAIQVALTAVAGEPLRESAHRALIKAHIAEGNPAEAVRQYRLCQRLLADELAVDPAPETSSLVEHLLPSAVREPNASGIRGVMAS